LLPACASQSDSQKSPWRNPKDGMPFVWVWAGSLTAHVPVGGDPEKTVAQEVAVEGFWLGRTEVTVGQFQRFVEQTGYITDAEKAGNRFTWKWPGFPQRADHPVVYVSYHDARSYARWAGVDLPTEAEWLYACRAGSATTFSWGDRVDDRYLWHRGNTQGLGTRPVARKRPNAWGLYDMVGNAWEYCQVCETCFALRGASWTRCPQYRTRAGTLTGDLLGAAVELRLQPCDHNNKYPPYPWDDDRGFRCISRVGPEDICNGPHEGYEASQNRVSEITSQSLP
jgi:formylglycine-generating enzyme required for sulfatase activity